jgi:DNA-binding IclR family transcriptional regulator
MPEELKEKEARYVQSLERALNILEVMAQEGASMTVTDLSEKVGLKISTVHRLLTTLSHRGYVQQDSESSRYRLGLKMLEIGNAALYRSDIRTEARPYLEELVERCNETANLAVLEGINIVYIDQVESHNLIIVKMFAQPGNRGPVHCTASGKALLAYLPPDKLETVLSQVEFVRYTNETITDREHLEKELTRIRQEKYALDWGEMEEHVRCIAAPIFNHEGKAIASISISGPSNRITTYYMKNELVDIVIGVANRISKKMGYSGLQ